METMKVFKQDNKWMYELSVSEGTSIITIKGLVTDTSELPIIGSEPEPNPVEKIVDSSDSLTKYSANWSHFSGQSWNTNHYNKTVSFTTVKDSSLTLTFSGDKVEWFSEKRVNHGIAAVSIDNGRETLVDLYDPRTDNTSQKVFESTVSSGEHTIKIRMTGNKNSLASENNIIHDYFKITS